MLSIEADKSSEMNRSYSREVEFLALSDFQKDSKEIAGKILAGGRGGAEGIFHIPTGDCGHFIICVARISFRMIIQEIKAHVPY